MTHTKNRNKTGGWTSTIWIGTTWRSWLRRTTGCSSVSSRFAPPFSASSCSHYFLKINNLNFKIKSQNVLTSDSTRRHKFESLKMKQLKKVDCGVGPNQRVLGALRVVADYFPERRQRLDGRCALMVLHPTHPYGGTLSFM